MAKKLTIEEVRMFVEENSQCGLISTEYINARTKLKFRCNCGKEFERTFDNFKRKKTTLCQSCSNIRQMSTNAKTKISKKSLKPLSDVIILVENSGLKYIDRYVRNKTRSTMLIVECPIHGILEVYYSNLRQRKSCPECNSNNLQNSKITIEVERWLNDSGEHFIREYKFQDCRDKRELPFDFYLPKLNTCIEVDGRQHFEKAYFGNMSENETEIMLNYTKRHDEIKNQYCKQNNIKILRIPYWERNNIEKVLKNALSFNSI